MRSPYSDLPPRNFWKTGVAEQHPLTIEGLYKKKFDIDKDAKIATGGSCFAQHISNYMRKLDFCVIDAEPPPPGLTEKMAKKFGYLLYSARYGNIYVVRQLLQLAKEAFGVFKPKNAVWEKDGRFYDAMRPSVEPNGLDSPDHVRLHRQLHLKNVRDVFEMANIFVFTLGLTESWIHKASGTTYPTAPGTIAGSFDPDVFAFKNFTFDEILTDFLKFRTLVRKYNPTLKFLLTVSPVPLTGTATNSHVLAATTYSKSVLRAVAGQLYDTLDDVDYFPSYEMIASPFSKGFFYEPNLRSVTDGGVQTVMRVFFQEHGQEGQPKIPAEAKRPRPKTAIHAHQKKEDVVCEDLLIEAFAQ